MVRRSSPSSQRGPLSLQMSRREAAGDVARIAIAKRDPAARCLNPASLLGTNGRSRGCYAKHLL
jgi:hypothetical protein